MNHSKYVMRLVLASASVFLFACSRANEETSKLSIQLPSVSTSSSKKIETLGAAAGGTVGTEWAGTIPNDVNSFNCYAVAITGPEPILNRNRCGKKIAAGSDDFTSDLYFGPMVGIQPAGTELSLDVISGEGRQVILMGFVANAVTDCMFYNSELLDKSKLSKPYIIGRSDKLSLKPGTEVSVPVKMTYDSSQFFEKCEGPEFTKTTGTNNVATQVSLEKDSYPRNATVENSCNELSISLRDSSYRTASAPTPTQIALKITNSQSTNAPLTTYETFSDCNAGVGGATAFAIAAGSTHASRWFKTDSNASISSNTVTLDLSATTLKPEAVNTTTNMKNGVGTDVKLLIAGPSLVVAGQCYQYDLSYRKFNRTYLGGDSQNISFSLGNGALVYETAGCTGMPNTAASTNATRTTYNINMGSSSNYWKSIYIKFPTGGETSILKFDKGASTYTAAEPDAIPVFASNSNTTVTATTSREDKILGKYPYQCYGPFIMELTNSYGIAVPNLSAMNIDMLLLNMMPSNVEISDKYDCSTTVSQITIPMGKSYGIYYIHTLSSPPLGTYPISFYNATTGLRFSTGFTLN